MLEGKHIGKLCVAGSKLPAFAWIKHIIGSCCDADPVAKKKNLPLQCEYLCVCCLGFVCERDAAHNYNSGG